jgi:hypothetical protein
MKKLIIAGAFLSAAVVGGSAFVRVPHSMLVKNQSVTDTIPGQRMDSTTHRWNSPTDTTMHRDSMLVRH